MGSVHPICSVWRRSISGGGTHQCKTTRPSVAPHLSNKRLNSEAVQEHFRRCPTGELRFVQQEPHSSDRGHLCVNTLSVSPSFILIFIRCRGLGCPQATAESLTKLRQRKAQDCIPSIVCEA